jgi:hypothetical protein
MSPFAYGFIIGAWVALGAVYLVLCARDGIRKAKRQRGGL